MKLIVPIAFVLMCTAQWYVSASMIIEHENVLNTGNVYRFRTEPIDPSDPFRGKYITLDFESELYEYPTRKWAYGEKVFVSVKEDSEGFAFVDAILETPPSEGDYVAAEVMFSSEDRVRVKFPFKRFYLEESKASDAEKVYRENRTDSTQVAYGVVRIKNGKSVLEDVRINDKSIVDVVREMNADQ